MASAGVAVCAKKTLLHATTARHNCTQQLLQASRWLLLQAHRAGYTSPHGIYVYVCTYVGTSGETASSAVSSFITKRRSLSFASMAVNFASCLCDDSASTTLFKKSASLPASVRGRARVASASVPACSKPRVGRQNRHGQGSSCVRLGLQRTGGDGGRNLKC